MSFIDSNFGNNQDMLYAMYKRRQNNNNSSPFQQSQPIQQQQAPQGFGWQQAPIGGLIGLGKSIYDNAMARRHDGMYKGVNVGANSIGTMSDKDLWEMQNMNTNFNTVGNNAQGIGFFPVNENSILGGF